MIQVQKEIIHARRSRIPFQKIPISMECEIVEESITWLNNIPSRCGISEHFSPKMVLIGSTLECEKKCKFGFGSFTQVSHETYPTNEMS